MLTTRDGPAVIDANWSKIAIFGPVRRSPSSIVLLVYFASYSRYDHGADNERRTDDGLGGPTIN